jgi:diacylglycerol kinase
MKESVTVSARLKSFAYAFRGILIMLKSQRNAWIHALATIIVSAMGVGFGFTRSEWCWIALAIVVVWTAEALNTALEFLMDAATPEYHPLVEKAKDVAAGAVLISAAGAAVIGLLIMGPYLLKLLGKV